MQEVLDTNNIQADNQSDARKDKLEADAVWKMMESAEQIVVAKGKKVETFEPNDNLRDDILSAVLGRSGSLRAPTAQVGNVFYVGYNDTIYSEPPFESG